MLLCCCAGVVAVLDRGYFANTLVYAFNKPDRPENCVCFWDTVTDERHIKYVKKLIAIRAAGENCVFATRTEDNSGQFILILCNAIGSPVDSKYIDIEVGRFVGRPPLGARRSPLACPSVCACLTVCHALCCVLPCMCVLHVTADPHRNDPVPRVCGQ